MDTHTHNNALIAPLRAAMCSFSEADVRKAMSDLIAADAPIHMPCPFGDMTGPDELYETAMRLYLQVFLTWSAAIGLS